MAMALNLGLLIIPPKHSTIEESKAHLMVNNKVTYQRQSWIPNTPAGMQAVFIQLQPTRIIWYLLLSKSTRSNTTHV